MRRRLDQIQRLAVVGIRRPGQYIAAVSVLAAGLLSSLRVFHPVTEWIDHQPGLIDSDWLNTVIITPMVYLVLEGLSLLAKRAVGRDPFEALANAIDRSEAAPSLTKHFERRMAGDPALAKTRALDYRMRIITRRELLMLCQINREVFGTTSFSLTLDTIKKRNQSLFEANPLTFAFIEASIDGRFVPIGMSNILPLNSIGDSQYCRNNGLKDAQLRGVHVAAPNQWPESLLLFSMGILRSFRGHLRDSPLTLANVFVDHLAEIVTAARQHNPDRTHLRVLAQTEHPRGGIGRLIQHAGFVDSGIMTGDGYPLWEIHGEIPRSQTSPGALKPLFRSLLNLKIRRRPN